MTRRQRFVCAMLAAVVAAVPATVLGAEETTVPMSIQAARRGMLKDRFEALSRLGAIRDREALRQWKVIPVLIEFAKDTNPLFAKAATEELGRLYGFDSGIKHDILQPLIGLLGDKKGHNIVRIQAAKLLGKTCVAKEIQDRDTIDALVKSAKPTDDNAPEVAVVCIGELGRIGDPRGRAAVRESLSYTSPTDEDAQSEVRCAGIAALLDAFKGPYAQEWNDRALPGRLLDLLRDRDLPSDTRSQVIELIGHIGSGEDQLLKAVDAADTPEAAISALRALTTMGSKKAAPKFRAVYDRLTKAEQGEEQAAAEARGMVCAMAGELLAMWSANEKILPRGGPEQLTKLLIAAMTDSDPSVVTHAVIGLGMLYDTRYDRTAAAQNLVAIMGAEGVPDEIRTYAARSLEAITGRVLGNDAKRWEALISKSKNLKLLKSRKGR